MFAGIDSYYISYEGHDASRTSHLPLYLATITSRTRHATSLIFREHLYNFLSSINFAANLKGCVEWAPSTKYHAHCLVRGGRKPTGNASNAFHFHLKKVEDETQIQSLINYITKQSDISRANAMLMERGFAPLDANIFTDDDPN